MSNILDKTDQSKRRVFVEKSDKEISKREMYRWSSSSSPGVFMEIPKANLNIDGRYQRDEVSRAKVLDIARNFDWKLFGVLSVVMRGDQTFWVFDGGNRTRAAFLRDDINCLPCMVFEVTDIANEAKAFVGTNTLANAVSSYHKHRASVIAKEPVAIQIEAILARHGYKASFGYVKHGFEALATLRRIVKKDADKADKVFGLCTAMSPDGGRICKDVLEGLFECATKVSDQADILSGPYAEKLQSAGMELVSAEIRRKSVILGKGGVLTWSTAILEVLNKGNRKKLVF